ncbi:MAG: alpha/beta hydrolase [Alicyclobacillus sp.]|nr:alpha/beta hydrolase [Alicyclobacillus sp.]
MIRDTIESWERRCNEDEEAKLLGAGVSFDFSMTFDGEVLFCSIRDGQYTFQHGVGKADVHLVIPSERWDQFLQPIPGPFYTTFNAMNARFQDVYVEGDQLKWAQFVTLIEVVLRCARVSRSDISATMPSQFDVSTIRGHYINFRDSDGTSNSVLYYEESGNGQPIIFLHTAGSDSRQYRYLMANTELQKTFHMFAFDLPYHGKSDPVYGWWQAKYTLTTNKYAQWIRDFIRQLQLEERPILVGCSMAGAIVLYLAAEYGDEFTAAISLEGGFRTGGRDVPWLNHPMVHAGWFLHSWVNGLMAPQSPEMLRRLTLWHYAQGGPGVYQGDINFYSLDWPEVSKTLGRAKCPLWVLTGEYDYSCTPESSREAAQRLGGTFIEMKGIGHFPMSENPELLLTYLQPILQQIAVLRTN